MMTIIYGEGFVANTIIIIWIHRFCWII